MANEIIMTFQTALNNAGLTDNYSSGSLAIDQASAKMTRNVQTIGTSESALVLGGVTVPGISVFVNLDDTNFVEVGVTGTMFVKLNPGEACVLRLTTTAPYAVADTAAVELFYIMYED